MLMSEIIAVINEIIDILAGLKAIGGDQQAAMHAALEPQAQGKTGTASGALHDPVVSGIMMPPDPA
jgi:hypothetical protein